MTIRPEDQVYYAHECTDRNGQPYYLNCSPDIRFVRAHHFNEPIVEVRLREFDPTIDTEPSRYWGWLDTFNGQEPDRYVFVWPSSMQVEMCFPNGTAAEAARRRGRLVNLVLTLHSNDDQQQTP